MKLRVAPASSTSRLYHLLSRLLGSCETRSWFICPRPAGRWITDHVARDCRSGWASAIFFHGGQDIVWLGSHLDPFTTITSGSTNYNYTTCRSKCDTHISVNQVKQHSFLSPCPNCMQCVRASATKSGWFMAFPNALNSVRGKQESHILSEGLFLFLPVSCVESFVWSRTRRQPAFKGFVSAQLRTCFCCAWERNLHLVSFPEPWQSWWPADLPWGILLVTVTASPF